MSHNEMLCHMSDQIRCVIGEKEFKSMSVGMPLWLLKFMVFRLPWQKNLRTHPDFDKDKRGTTVKDFETDKNELIRLVSLVSQWPSNQTLDSHPVFGPLSRKQWGTLIADHLDWHLKQFSA